MFSLKTPATLASVLVTLQTQGLDRLDAQLLLLHVLGQPLHARAWLLAHDSDPLPPAAQAILAACVQRRLRGEPLAYICGQKEFFGLNLTVDPRVLVPRPDTETLVEWALEVLANKVGASVIDLGTGSGAIALALKHTRPDLQVSALDYSHDALAVTRSNAQRLSLAVDLQQGCWLAGVTARFDAIVANPPYIAAHDHHLEALTHEPTQALVSGPDGLDDIRTIIAQAQNHLHPGGWLLLEHGFDQASQVRDELRQAGFMNAQSRSDLSGIERCSGAMHAPV